jgi:chaperone required for assembly of F1-ATPase
MYLSLFEMQMNVCVDMQFMITLDGRTLRTPARNSLEFDKIGLALAVAAEWDAQTDTKRGIQPPTMPMMSLASTAIDQISLDPSDAISTCMGYLGTDTALFWAPLGEFIHMPCTDEMIHFLCVMLGVDGLAHMRLKCQLF